MSNIDKIRQEIERRKKICEDIFERESDTYYQGKAVAYGELLPFIDSLPDEHLRDSTKMISEDERIRKWMVELVESQMPKTFIEVKKQDVFAWLERQKEQKPVQSKEEKEYVRTLKGLVSDFIRDSGGGITDVEYYQNICDWLDGRHIEQKPVEYLDKDKVYAIMNKLTNLSYSNLIPFASEEYVKIHEITFDVRRLLDYPIEQKPRWEINNPHTTKWTKEMIDEKFEELVKEYHKQKPVVTHGETYHVDTLGTQQVIAGKMPQKPAEWSEEDERMRQTAIEACKTVAEDYENSNARFYKCKDWLEYRLKSLRPQQKVEWSEEDENKIESIKGLITMGKFVDTNTIKTIWKLLDSLRPQPKVEWSEEDEEMLNSCICSIEESKENRYAYKENDGDTSYDREIAWLKSLRPQPREEIYQAAKHDLAIRFMNYLDENRPDGKMSLSNGECEDIDKAFKENNWKKIIRYAEKYGKKN